MTGSGASALLLAARVMMSIEFVLFGSMKIINTQAMQDYMEAGGVPGELIWLAVVVQLAGGLCLLVGYRTRQAALMLAGFCIVATVLFHTNFSDLGEVSDFTKDLATAGGFIVLFVCGPGALSLDAWLQARASAKYPRVD
jgi:putative oxidoreductase